jgi:hypothetical protein
MRLVNWIRDFLNTSISLVCCAERFLKRSLRSALIKKSALPNALDKKRVTGWQAG